MFLSKPKLMRGRVSVRFGALAMLALLALPAGTARADGLTLVRDAETERLIRNYSMPIWRAAGLTPSSITVHLVMDPNINAFVISGQDAFYNTGLITQADSPMEIVGVIAHETGHMAGAHRSRSTEAMNKAAIPYYASMIAGVAAIAAGAGDAGMAILAGGAQVAQRSILSYSREQEARADQAGATFLQRAHISGKGMLELFAKFRDQEALSSQAQDPFVRSHPISEDRLASLEERVKASPYYDTPDAPEAIHELKMVQAKLFGYVDDSAVTLRRYPLSDQSDYAHYARTVAYHKDGADEKAMAELAPLLAKMPNDPYVWELKGQIEFEGGKVEESIPSYRKARALDPDEPQFDLALGQSLLATEKKEYEPEALALLKNAISRDKNNPFAFYQLSVAYGRMNQIGLAELSTAEYYEAVGSQTDAVGHALQAQTLLKNGSPDWLRAQDIAIANSPEKN